MRPDREAFVDNRVLLRLHDWDLARLTPRGETPVLRGVDLTIRRGEWLALLGANGSGKTSLLRYLATAEPLASVSAFVAQDPDEQLLCATVAEELALGRPELAVVALLAEYGLTAQADLDPRLLSAGQKQRLQVAIALAAEPEVLLCDEPTSLQDAAQAAWLLAHLDLWRRRTGGTVIAATQDRTELAPADRAAILGDGRLLREGPVALVAADPLAAALLGDGCRAVPPGTAAVDPVVPADPPGPAVPARRTEEATSLRPSAGPIARWDRLGCRFAAAGDGFAGVNLVIAAGDRIGITGPNGCGKSTLLAAAVGIRPPDTGRVLLGNQLIYRRGGPDLDHGMALLAPQFPEYAFTQASVAAEVAVDPILARRGVAAVLEAAGLPSIVAATDPHALSSGQKRRLALALVLLARRPLLLLDEPTVALDRAGRRAVRRLIAAVPSDSAIVIASHDAALLRACGCRVLLLTPDGLQPADRDAAGGSAPSGN
jgi:energy-coupling factor transporter ATP-binding protein EcfA2